MGSSPRRALQRPAARSRRRRTPPRAVCPDRRRAPSLVRDGAVERGEQWLGVPRLVEDVGGEDEVERRARRRTGAPVEHGRRHAQSVRGRVRPQQLHCLGRPVGRERLGAGERRRERRQSQAAAELEHPHAVERQPHDVTRERDPARPELGPVRHELVDLEALLVDEALRVVGSHQHELVRADHDPLLLHAASLPAMKKRLDVLLVERGLAESRSQAQALVIAGRVPGYDKPGTQLDESGPARGRAAAAVRLARRREARARTRGLPRRSLRQALPRRRRLDRWIHRLPAPGRRGAGDRARRRLRAAAPAAARRRSRDRARTHERAHGHEPPVRARARRLRRLLHLGEDGAAARARVSPHPAGRRSCS